jgi:Lon protease-like protein
MSRRTSLPAQVPILPLFDQAVLFPGLLLRLSITSPTSTALLSNALRSDQQTLINLVLGCVPVRPGSQLAEIIGDGSDARPALPASESTSEHAPLEKVATIHEYGCSARIKTVSRLDRSYGTSGFVLVVEGNTPLFWTDKRDFSLPNR